MKKFIYILYIFVFSLGYSNQTIGLVTKTKGKVEYQKFSEKKFTSNIYKGLGLYGDDRIRTGENGFSIYRYLDDASSIKILKNSNVILNFNIDNEADEYFTIVTPTSVATVKGTEFWLICNGPEGDKFLGVEGEVEVKNIESGRVVMLTQDSQVISTGSGTITSQNMTSQDIEQIQNLDQEDGDYDSSDIDTGFDDTIDTQSINSDLDVTTNNENVIRIQLEDSQGNIKEIIVKYK